jgi:prepilin-type N-terminal cleavage/methylation domain-containing protein
MKMLRFPFGQSGCRAFTLVEMLVVITIISILASLLLPTLDKAINAARGASCANNQKQVGMMTVMYLDQNNATLPKYDSYGAYACWLLEAAGMKQINAWHNAAIECSAGAGRGLFACPAVPLDLVGSSNAGTPVGFSYTPTLTAWSATCPLLTSGAPYGGYQLYFNSPAELGGKRFSRVTDRSVGMIETWVSEYASTTYNGTVYSILRPPLVGAFYTMYYNSMLPYALSAPNNSATFAHNGSSNFLYKDGSVLSSPLGTKWNLNWQLEK